MDTTTALSIRGLSKTFAGQLALDGVDLDIADGQITALLGMNGSGKSTLIKILAGVYQPDPNALLTVRGRVLPFPLDPSTAHDAGLRFLHQDLGLVDELTISDNFALANGFFARGTFTRLDARRQHQHTAATLALVGIDEDPATPVARLSPATRTMVGIARAFQDKASAGGTDGGRTPTLRDRILVLDEPTASLPAHEAERVLELLHQLRSQGGTAIYVSHRIEEVRRIADRVAVLRDGVLVADEPLGARDAREIVSLVVGRELQVPQRRADARSQGPARMRIRGLSGPRLAGVDLDLNVGEIVGVTGLMGCGRSELVRMLAGAQQPAAGTIELDDAPYTPATPGKAIAAGVACVPQNRRRDGIVLPLGVAENLTLGRLAAFTRGPVLNRAAEASAAGELARRYLVKAASLASPIRSLSGGNQQKVVVARAASGTPKVLLLDEPSQGVDALARQEIASLLRGLAEQGVAVLVASTDHDDFVGLADRVLVLDRGRVVAELAGEELTEDAIALACQTGAPTPTSA